MKIIDRDGRLFGKISIVDVIVLLVVAAMVAAVYTKNPQWPQTAPSGGPDGGLSDGLENQPEYMLDAIQVGDQMFDKERSTGGSLGTITDIQVSGGTMKASLNDGTVAMLPAEGCLTSF